MTLGPLELPCFSLTILTCICFVYFFRILCKRSTSLISRCFSTLAAFLLSRYFSLLAFFFYKLLLCFPWFLLFRSGIISFSVPRSSFSCSFDGFSLDGSDDAPSSLVHERHHLPWCTSRSVNHWMRSKISTRSQRQPQGVFDIENGNKEIGRVARLCHILVGGQPSRCYLRPRHQQKSLEGWRWSTWSEWTSSC